MWIYLLTALCLSGCTDQIKTIGFAPKTEKELIGQNITELQDNYLIAKDIRSHGEKYYLGQIKYSFNKIKASYKTLEHTVYELQVDKEGNVIKALLLPIPNKNVQFNASMPSLPDRSSLLSKLFADVGSVSII